MGATTLGARAMARYLVDAGDTPVRVQGSLPHELLVEESERQSIIQARPGAWPGGG